MSSYESPDIELFSSSGWLGAGDTTILLTPVNISTRSFQASVFLRFWALLLKAGYGCRITNRQTSININTDWAAMTNLRDTGATSGPGHTGDHSQPIVGLRKKFSCPASLGQGRAPPTGPTDGSDDLQPAEGEGDYFL